MGRKAHVPKNYNKDLNYESENKDLALHYVQLSG